VPKSASALIPEQRQQELLRLLRGTGVLSIRQVTQQLGVSHMTVRRDIAVLEQAGQVVAVQGGVRLAEWHGQQPPRERQSRMSLEMPRKRAIAAEAATLVPNDAVVFLDAGTTCQSVVPHLAGRTGLTVVTNDFHAVIALLDHPGIETIHTGGVVDTASASSSGALAAGAVADINIDVALLSTGAWDLVHGVTTPQLDKVLLKRAVLDAATTSALLADSTKWGTRERCNVVGLDGIDVVVTDDGLPESAAASIAEAGPDVRRVPV
jgi:DeoR/GlpR family transcriptional regulator of sugar metabolism